MHINIKINESKNKMVNKIKIFSKLRKQHNNSLIITRFSDLIKLKIDIDKFAKKVAIFDKEVWGNITDDNYIRTEEKVKSHFKICPNLIYCAFENGKLIATVGSIYTTESEMKNKKTWLKKTANGFLTTHMPNGDVVFGVDLSVKKGAPKKISDKIVFSAIFIGLIGEGKKTVYIGSRIPSYHKYKDMNVDDYVFGKRKNGKPFDPELYFYLKNGFEIVEIIPEYMEDPESLNYGVLIKWDNPLYKITKIFPFLKILIKFIGEKIFLRLPKKPIDL